MSFKPACNFIKSTANTRLTEAQCFLADMQILQDIEAKRADLMSSVMEWLYNDC